MEVVSMANQQRRRYTKEFKEQAVELTYSSGKQVKEVAEDLGINASMLGRWRREMKENSYGCFPGAGNVQHASSEAAEIARLKKELAIVTEERDILKKAVAIFSRQPK
jgi:transposase